MNNNKFNKLLSVVLSIVLLMTALWVPMVVSAASDSTSNTTSGSSWAVQLSKDIDDNIISYEGYDWDAFGTNLIPDPTVSHFVDDGKGGRVYGRYIDKFDENFQPGQPNDYYWWDKYIEKGNGFVMYYAAAVEAGLLEMNEPDAHGYYTIPNQAFGAIKNGGAYQVGGVPYRNGFQSVGNRSYTVEGTSLTDDGSGVIKMASGLGARAVPLPTMDANSYYVVKFNFKLDGNYESTLDFCPAPNADKNDLISQEDIPATIWYGDGFGQNKVDTAFFVVYTGDSAYTDPFIRIYCKDNVDTMLDDFGMYKVEKAVAENLAGIESEPEEAPGEKWAKQNSIDSENNIISYEKFNWDAYGTNLIPDPTVNHFVNDGNGGRVYGRYIDKFDENFQPGQPNDYYWWDKYIEIENGFVMYYAAAVEAGLLEMDEPDAAGYYTIPKKAFGAVKNGGAYQVGGVPYRNGFQSVGNRSYTVEGTSLTDDGSGVITMASGLGARAVPLPAMDANSYYIVKFNFKLDGNYESTLDFCYAPNKEYNDLIAQPDVAATINFGDGFGEDKVDTACFVVYTGDSAYADPFIRIYCKDNVDTYLDDFGMYKVSQQDALIFLGLEEPEKNIPSWAIQTTRFGGPEGEKIIYSGYDWDALGANLIPDPTVAHFNQDGTYGKYAITSAGGDPAEINPYYWWDKYIEESNGFKMYYQDIADGTLDKNVNGTSYDQMYRSPANRDGCVTKNYPSLTNDGTGVLTDTSSGGTRMYPLPAMEKDSYYVIKYKLQCVEVIDDEASFCFEPTPDQPLAFGNAASTIKLGEEFAANGTTETVSYLVYTGSKAYSDPFVKIYVTSRIFVDDFGMYKVSKEFADQCSDGAKLADPSYNLSKDAKSLNLNKNELTNESSSCYDFSSVNWNAFGENLIPDPTISAFLDDGNGGKVYGKYATPNANWMPENVNKNFWWDKYVDLYNGFTMYYQDMADGTMDKNVDGVAYTQIYRSPANSSMALTTDSLTDDGSGVLTTKTNGAYRYFPLPSVEKYSYYIIKLNVKADNVAWDPNGAFGIDLDLDTRIYSMFPHHTSADNIYTFATIFYTGDKEYKDPYFWFSLWGQQIWVDDIYMYKVDAGTAEQIFASGKVVEPIGVLSEVPGVTQTVYNETGTLNNYTDTKWNLYGENLVDAANKIEKSSQNGEEIKYELPDMAPYSYYLVKMRADFANVNNTDDVDVYNGDELIKNQLFDMSGLGTDKNYITTIIYTGNKEFNDAFIKFWLDAGNSVSLDEFAVYKLKVSYAQLSILDSKLLPVSYLETVPVAVKTDPIDEYDYESNDNLITDGSFEQDAAAEALTDAKFGSKALKISSKTNVEFKADTTTYYMISAWIKSANTGNANFTISQKEASTLVAKASYTLSSGWTKVAMILYTSDVTDYILSFASDAQFFVDGLSVVKLAGSANLACKDLDSYIDGTYDPNRLESAAPVFGVEGNMYSTLKSPYYAVLGEDVTYRELYLKYLELCEKLGNINQGYAPSGEGSRNNYKEFITKEENNLIADGSFSNESYWKGADTVASENIAITNEYSISGTALKFTGGKNSKGSAIVYKKRITNLKPNTTYYLRINGMGLGEVISDVDFGFMDTTYGLELRNPIDAASANDATYINTHHQRINFKCQDGTWYVRGYRFNTGDNTELDFFIRGSIGTVYFDDIMIFEQSKAYTVTSSGKISDMAVLEYAESKFACDDKDNLVPNGQFTKGTEFWGNFNGMGKFVEVVKSEGNSMLHFKGDNMSYYYLPWVEVKANVAYTFSYWKKNLNGEKSRSLVVSEYNPHGYASQVYSVAEKYGEWELVSVKFVSHVDNRIALGIQSLDGEAVFDNVRLFESDKGYSVSQIEDMPIGGNTFESTELGTDGVAENEIERPDEEPKEDAPVEDEPVTEEPEDEETEDEVIETVTKKRRKKVIPGTVNYGLIIAAIVGGVVVLAGGVLLIIFLKKKKRKN